MRTELASGAGGFVLGLTAGRAHLRSKAPRAVGFTLGDLGIMQIEGSGPDGTRRINVHQGMRVSRGAKPGTIVVKGRNGPSSTLNVGEGAKLVFFNADGTGPVNFPMAATLTPERLTLEEYGFAVV